MIDDEILELVRNMSEAVKVKDLEMKRMIVAERCCSKIYNEWGIGNNSLWEKVYEAVEIIIPMDEQ